MTWILGHDIIPTQNPMSALNMALLSVVLTVAHVAQHVGGPYHEYLAVPWLTVLCSLSQFLAATSMTVALAGIVSAFV